jgi:hypothetical protein
VPAWLIEKGERGRAYQIEAEGAIAWWEQKREVELLANEERQGRLQQMRLKLVGETGEGEQQLTMSGKARREEYLAAMEAVKYRKMPRPAAREGRGRAGDQRAAVELRRRLQQIAPEFGIAAGLQADQVKDLAGGSRARSRRSSPRSRSPTRSRTDDAARGRPGPAPLRRRGPIVAGALAELRFPERIPVNEAADRTACCSTRAPIRAPGARARTTCASPNGRWTRCGSDSPYREVVVMGPSQTGKSEVGNNWQLHTVIYDPADMLFVMPDRVSIDQYVKTQWNKMIELADDDLAEAPARPAPRPTRSTSRCSAAAASSSAGRAGRPSASKPISRGRVDELDELPQDIGAKDGQGDAAVAAARPRRQLLGLWRRQDLREFVAEARPPARHRGAGRRRHRTSAGGSTACLRRAVRARHRDLPQVRRDRHAARGRRVGEVVCPGQECGGDHRQQDKAALMATGRWVGRGETAVSRQHDPEGKTASWCRTRRLSQRWDGLMGFRRWSDMAEQWRTAELAYENEQDEAPLKTFFQTVIGKNYTPKGAGGEARGHRGGAAQARQGRALAASDVPREARCVVMAVDQAVNRFEVAAWAFGPGFRAWLIDRFPILVCGDEPLQPFTRPEHFAVLYDKVLSKRYPVAGAPELLVKPLGTCSTPAAWTARPTMPMPGGARW